jgi:hypothetical protein
VTVTIIEGPRGPSIRERVANVRIQVNPLLLIGLAMAAAVIANTVATTALGGGGGTARTESAQPRAASAAQAAAAYGHPPRCPAAKPHHGRIALADFDRMVWCERYHGTPNSSIYQFIGAP